MKNTLMPIVRTDIAEDIEKNLGKKIILLTGAEGSGKSYIAKAIATNNLQKKYKELIRLKCINCGRMIMMPRYEFNKKIKKIVED